jgi:hypothetical protein
MGAALSLPSFGGGGGPSKTRQVKAKPKAKAKARPKAKVARTRRAKSLPKPRRLRRGRSRFEEEFTTPHPAAYMAASVQTSLKRPVSKYAEEEYEGPTQKYEAADFTNVATPVNFSLILVVLLFIAIVATRR